MVGWTTKRLKFSAESCYEDQNWMLSSSGTLQMAVYFPLWTLEISWRTKGRMHHSHMPKASYSRMNLMTGVRCQVTIIYNIIYPVRILIRFDLKNESLKPQFLSNLKVESKLISRFVAYVHILKYLYYTEFDKKHQLKSKNITRKANIYNFFLSLLRGKMAMYLFFNPISRRNLKQLHWCKAHKVAVLQ